MVGIAQCPAAFYRSVPLYLQSIAFSLTRGKYDNLTIQQRRLCCLVVKARV